MIILKEVQVPRGKNIGQAIINSFIDYSRIDVKTTLTTRDVVNKQNNVSLSYTYKKKK